MARISSAIIPVVLALFLLATMSVDAAAPPAASGRLAVGLGATQTSLDLSLFFGLPVLNPAIHLFDFLVWRDEAMQIKPMLATAWSFPTPTTLRFTLRQDVRFHNGDPMTADDVVYTIRRVLDPAMRSRHRAFLDGIMDTRAVDGSSPAASGRQSPPTGPARFF